MIELLSPVGDFECLKAAVQNGANAVYLGASDFSARSSAKNFDLDELEEAISYAHLRNVKVFLALNTLIKNSELNKAINNSKAKTMYVCNLFTQPGETDDFKVSDHINLLEKYFMRGNLLCLYLIS